MNDSFTRSEDCLTLNIYTPGKIMGFAPENMLNKLNLMLTYHFFVQLM